MIFDETRDNTTAIEATIIEADARADIENTAIFNPGSWKAQRLAQAEAMFGKSDGKIAAEKKAAEYAVAAHIRR